MTGKTITIALAFLAGATSTALPQSQRNFGPNGPSSTVVTGRPIPARLRPIAQARDRDRRRSTCPTSNIRGNISNIRSRNTRSGRSGSGSGCIERNRVCVPLLQRKIL